MTLHKPFWFALITSALVLSSCNDTAVSDSEKQTTNIDNPAGLSDKMKTFVAQFPAIVIISDKSCLSCNKKMVKITEEFLQGSSFGVVLETNGGVFDVSALLKEEYTQNVIMDHKRELTKEFKTSNSFVLARKVDDSESFKVLEITTENLGQFENILKTVVGNKS